MNYRDYKNKQEREELTNFIKDKVLGDDFDFNDLCYLSETVKKMNKDDNLESAFCDYLELGNWFYEALISCDFNAKDFFQELEDEFQKEISENIKEKIKQDEDCLRMVGAK